MPVRYVIHKEQRLIATIGEGRVTFDEARADQDKLLCDPDFDPTFNQLIDGDYRDRHGRVPGRGKATCPTQHCVPEFEACLPCGKCAHLRSGAHAADLL